MRSPIFIICLFLFGASPVIAADWLEWSDSLPPIATRSISTNLNLSGAHGLLTISGPTLNSSQTMQFGTKFGVSDGEIRLAGQQHNVEKREWWTFLAYPIMPNLELTITHLQSDRSGNPGSPLLDGGANATAFGFAYTFPKQDFVFGGGFSPLSNDAQKNVDLAQIEHLRHIFLTVTEDLAANTFGYLQFKYAFTRERTTIQPGGALQTHGAKQFLIAGLGIEFRTSGKASFFFEAQRFNYGQLQIGDSDPYSVNLGTRLRGRRFNAELSAVALTRDPTYYIGVTASR